MLTEDIDNTLDWEHKSYEKIAEGMDRLRLSVDDYRYLKRFEWIVTEKIHGANFSIITDGRNIRYAKRKEILNPSDKFFNHESLKSKLAYKVEEIYKLASKLYDGVKRVTIYGELFGGCYPHPDVVANKEVEAVQTGVYYSPDIEFCAFDIAIEFSDEMNRDYINYDKAMSLFEKAQIMYARPLFKGKFEAALDYHIGFRSTIPGQLGLPELEYENKAEGIVIKPVKSIFIQTAKGMVRPIIKKKITEFEEELRFHQARDWSRDCRQSENNMLELIISELKSLININRLNSAISKIGRVAKDSSIKNDLSKELFRDILESFNSKYDSYLELLNSDETQKMQECIKKEIDILIKEYLK